MIGAELRAFRDKQGWSQQQLVDFLNASLDRNYSPSKLSAWERDKIGVPGTVEVFLTTVQLEQAFPLTEERPLDPDPATDYTDPGADSAPPAPPGQDRPQPQAALSSGNAYARVCEELWEMVATGVGLIGAATGSEALRKDGEIILADKQALGRAYGKLAETNDTFRRMLMGATSGGAWLEVCLVTGLTAGKVMRSHQALAPPPLHAAPDLEAEMGVSFNGDGGVVHFPQPA